MKLIKFSDFSPPDFVSGVIVGLFFGFIYGYFFIQ